MDVPVVQKSQFSTKDFKPISVKNKILFLLISSKHFPLFENVEFSKERE